MDHPKQLIANDNILFGRKHFAKGAILTVGKEITEKEAEALLSMGKEISVLDEGVSSVGSSIEQEELITVLEKEKAALTAENAALMTEIEALKTPADKPDIQDVKKKKAGE
jgi:cell division protein FtsB